METSYLTDHHKITDKRDRETKCCLRRRRPGMEIPLSSSPSKGPARVGGSSSRQGPD
ncbi:hypothetical protein I79_009269 [Cricetulus griseus]|uniref:Uncharacterized protein n=1 Tax=Cricetulus griseus TaxID=10029 RepID=G3HFB3_CRIGR|nr:hypothetical protein I79_009269 [Cricetulus griseus]